MFTRNLVNYYDAVIVGAGPAGLFAAKELVENNKTVLIIEKGNKIEDRKCPMKIANKCCKCKTCSIMEGEGGAGTFSDGKLNLSTEVGGWLKDFITEEELQNLLKEVDDTFIECGAIKESKIPNSEDIHHFYERFKDKPIELILNEVKHMGSDEMPKIITNLRNKLIETGNCEILYNTIVKGVEEYYICYDNVNFNVIIDKDELGWPLEDDTAINCKDLIIAPGRSGSEFVKKFCKDEHLETKISPVDIGVRVEVPYFIFKDLTDKFYEFKGIITTPTFKDKVRTFCMCPQGEVTTEYHNTNNIITVNGHSNRNTKTGWTNFSLLDTCKFTEPFKEPIKYANAVSQLSNMLSGDSVIVQRFSDLLNNKRSKKDDLIDQEYTLKSAVPGDLSFVLPYRILSNIIEALKILGLDQPIIKDYVYIYGVETKLYSIQVVVDENMKVKNRDHLYMVGDGAGITRSIGQAAVSGILAAKGILKS